MNRSGWRYAAAGLFIASIAAVISYNDGLFVARLAGNHDHQAYLYPLLPDGLIVVCLLALLEAARGRLPRSRWAMGGLLLGAVLTLSMNVYAGLAHSVLDAVIDGFVPVIFFVACEVVLWHVRRGRGAVPQGEDSRGSPATRAASLRAFVPPVREIQGRQQCSPTTAGKARKEMQLLIRRIENEMSPPAGTRRPPSAPAGASGQDAFNPGGALAAQNGHQPAGGR